MANNKNLKSLSERSQRERNEIARKGAIAKNKKTAERKALRQELLLLLESGDTQNRLCTALLDKALAGDVKAFEVIRDSVGEKPVEQVMQIEPPKIIDDI